MSARVSMRINRKPVIVGSAQGAQCSPRTYSCIAVAALTPRRVPFLHPFPRRRSLFDHNTTHGPIVWPAHDHIPSSKFSHSRRVGPRSSAAIRLRLRECADSPLPLIQTTAVQCIEHVLVRAGASMRIAVVVAGVQHIAHVQPGALTTPRGGRGWGCL